VLAASPKLLGMKPKPDEQLGRIGWSWLLVAVLIGVLVAFVVLVADSGGFVA